MTQILILQERVSNSIMLGESHFREFKSAYEGPLGEKKPGNIKHLSRYIAEGLVGFANADGGELLVGVEDDGTVTGVPHNQTQIEKLMEAPNDHINTSTPLTLEKKAILEIEGKKILFFSVAKGTMEIYQLADGRCMKRCNESTMPVAAKEIIFERQEQRSRQFDRTFQDGASVNDLDLDLVQAVANSYLEGLSVDRYLQQTSLGEYAPGGLRLRKSALLLFSKNILDWHPRCQVRILKVSGNELKSGSEYNVTSDQTIKGNLFKLLSEAWDNLRPYLAYKTDFGPDARFQQRYIYPEQACREALVNAIAHRDYSIDNGIEVFIYDDRMEIVNPGGLLSTLSIKDIEKLRNAHESRNVYIARILRENEYMRELGEGMKRIFYLMKESELTTPKLLSDSREFKITFPHKSVFSEEQKNWLSLFDSFKLSGNQRKIVALGMHNNEISPYDIYKAMNTEDRNTYDTEVTYLRNKKILINFRSTTSAYKYAKQRSISKQKAPRFRVELPQDIPDPILEANDSASTSSTCKNIPWDISWEDLSNNYKGKSVKGSIKYIAPYGIFVQIARDWVGLIHSSLLEKNYHNKFLPKQAINVEIGVLYFNRTTGKPRIELKPV